MRSSRRPRPPMAASTSSMTAGASTRPSSTRCSSRCSAPESWSSISMATISIPADAATGRAKSWPSAAWASSVVDQPAYLTTHWAASSGLFLRRFGDCIRDFANNDDLKGEMVCNPRWGTMPSAELKLPPDMVEPRAPRAALPAVTTSGSGARRRRAQGLGRVPRCLVRLLPERARGSARDRSDPGRSADRRLFGRPQHRQQARRHLDPPQGPHHR